MGKETREKTRNQRDSAPYNASNSSFAKRFTSKVAEYIPSNWASVWFDNTEDPEEDTTTSNPNSIQVAAEINHYENASSNSKKTSIPNHNNLASNSNNRTTYASNALGNETCSPILNSERHLRDYQSAGTSGYRQPSKPHNLFVSSTPAFNVNKPSGENGSESGESTSGCSSLVSQSNKLRAGMDMAKSKSLFPNRQIPTDEITKSQNRSSGPQFDTSLFNSSSPSTNKSVNLSPFYPGRTTYGGASTYKKYSMGSNKSSTSPSIFQPSLRRASLCNQSKVNPSPTTLPKMSVVAENILKTIKAMTPVTTMMTMPTPEEVNNTPASLRSAGLGNGVKRKIKELQIPTVVNTNLIQLKRSERKNALSQSIQSALSSCSSSSDEDLDYAIVSNDAKRSLKEKMKRSRRDRIRNEEVQTDVNLPNVVLNVPSLPIIDIPLGKPSIDVSFSDPIECRDFNISSESSSLLSMSSNQDSNVNVNKNSSSVNFVYNTEPSKPIPRRSFTLSPVEVSPQTNLVLKKEPPKVGNTWDCEVCLNRFNPSDGVCKACGMPQEKNTKLDSTTEINKPSPSLIDKFKPASDTWECDSCCVRNKVDAVACVCCTTPKPGTKTSAPTPTPVATITGSTGGFGDLFKKPSGNWDCSVCMISNKSADEKCVACETAKPGTKTAATSASTNAMSGPKFPFATSSDSSSTFKFGIDKVDAKTSTPEIKPAVATSAAPSFSFGVPPASSAQPTFSFGMPKAQDSISEKKETSLSVPSTSNSTLTSPSNATVVSPTSTASNFMFKSTSSISTVSDSKPFSLVVSGSGPATTSTAEVKTNPISTPNFSFGNTNGPIFKPETTVLPSKPVEVKPSVSPTPKMSVFAFEANPSLSTNNTTNGQKPLASLFGPSTAVSNEESNKANISLDKKEVHFNLTPTSNGKQPPSKLTDFGKPGNPSEPAKASIFGAAAFDKPKENSLFPSSTSNAASSIFANNTSIATSKPEVFAFGSTSSSVNNAFSGAPSTKPYNFGSSASTPQANAQPSLSFASPTPAPAFSNLNSVPQPALSSQQTVHMFGGSNVFGSTAQSVAPTPTAAPMFGNITQPVAPTAAPMFGNTAQPVAPSSATAPMFGNTAQSAPTPTAASMFGNTAQSAAPMFGGGFGQPAAPSPAPFSFGAPAPTNNVSAGYQFGAQNSTPAPNTGFSFAAPPAAAPPAFDPQMRPTFNFTQGTVPLFSAQPGLTASNSIGARRIKKAVRKK